MLLQTLMFLNCYVTLLHVFNYSTLWALGTMGYKLDLRCKLTLTAELLKSLNPSALANLAWGLAVTCNYSATSSDSRYIPELSICINLAALYRIGMTVLTYRLRANTAIARELTELPTCIYLSVCWAAGSNAAVKPALPTCVLIIFCIMYRFVMLMLMYNVQ
jgi:hypothetical protein